MHCQLSFYLKYVPLQLSPERNFRNTLAQIDSATAARAVAERAALDAETKNVRTLVELSRQQGEQLKVLLINTSTECT